MNWLKPFFLAGVTTYSNIQYKTKSHITKNNYKLNLQTIIGDSKGGPWPPAENYVL